MTDDTTHDELLARILERLDALEAKNEDLEQQNRVLRAEVGELRQARTATRAPRRRLQLPRGGRGRGQAWWGWWGQPVILGQTNDAGSSQTSMTAAPSRVATLNVLNSSSFGRGVTGQGAIGVEGNSSVPAGGFIGVFGYGPYIGTSGKSVDTGVGVHGQVVGAGESPARGTAVEALVTPEPGGIYIPPDASSTAVLANNLGFGKGILAISEFGIPVMGQVGNASNGNPALIGSTPGSGPAVSGDQAGNGIGVLGQITNVANGHSAVAGVTDGSGPGVTGRTSGSGPGVVGQGSSVGRGGQFSGGAAQVRLEPASGSHPSSGQPGDLFLDNNKSLFLCKGGTTWVLVA